MELLKIGFVKDGIVEDEVNGTILHLEKYLKMDVNLLDNVWYLTVC